MNECARKTQRNSSIMFSHFINVHRQIKAMHNGVVLARKMGFPEVILPGEVRNDLYLTLVAGEFARGSKTSDKNIEVSVVVCNEQGALVSGALSLGAGAGAVDEYRSVIYYHDDRPKWNETFRVSLDCVLLLSLIQM